LKRFLSFLSDVPTLAFTDLIIVCPTFFVSALHRIVDARSTLDKPIDPWSFFKLHLQIF